MSPMTREQHILTLELGADPDRHRFLTGGQVRESGDLARGGEPLYVAFEQAYAPQRAVHILPVRERGFGHSGPRIPA